jgi:hypothetical protein
MNIAWHQWLAAAALKLDAMSTAAPGGNSLRRPALFDLESPTQSFSVFRVGIRGATPPPRG